MRTSSSSLSRKRKRKDLSPLDTILLVGWQPSSARHVDRRQWRTPRLDAIVSQRTRRDVPRRRGPDGASERREILPERPREGRPANETLSERCRVRRERTAGEDGGRDETDEKRRAGEGQSAQRDIAVLRLTWLKGKDFGRVSRGIARSLLLLALLCAQCCPAIAEALAGTQKYCTRTVKTRYGILRGVEARSSTAVETYYGVPYATPPLGALRYMPPVTPTPWRGTKFADTMPPACPQRPPEPDASLPHRRRAYLERLAPILANQSEDCLYLNLYVPKPPHGKSSPRGFHSAHSGCRFNKQLSTTGCLSLLQLAGAQSYARTGHQLLPVGNPLY